MAVLQERRKYSREGFPASFGISLLRPQGALIADSVNLSEGGLCLRLAEMLEVRSLVRLQLTQGHTFRRPVECTGRVAWVVQRLDLRDIPPFLFDVGIEFVDLPSRLRGVFGQRNGAAARPRAAHEKHLEPVFIRARQYVPRLTSEHNHQARWHLIVTVDDVPCFSGHYTSERQAEAAWSQFKKDQSRPSRAKSA